MRPSTRSVRGSHIPARSAPDSPSRRRILSEIQHVVVMGVTAHAHGDQLDQRRAASAARAFHRPVKAAAIASGSVPSIVIPGMP